MPHKPFGQNAAAGPTKQGLQNWLVENANLNVHDGVTYKIRPKGCDMRSINNGDQQLINE
jgi:hypothetical protein